MNYKFPDSRIVLPCFYHTLTAQRTGSTGNNKKKLELLHIRENCSQMTTINKYLPDMIDDSSHMGEGREGGENRFSFEAGDMS